MITVGYSTRTSNPNYKKYIQKMCMYKPVQIIEKVNNGEKNLSKVYNEILNESENDIVVLLHDDLEFDTKNWGEKILKLFEKNNDYGIIGLAGTTKLNSSGMWWEDKTKMFGIVNHKKDGKKWESKYSSSLGESLKNVVLVDGLFIAVKKSNLKSEFDEGVEGFHFYDIYFCVKNFLKKVKIGVTTNIRVTHLSIGVTNQQWETNKLKFVQKYKEILPLKIQSTKNDLLKILYCIDDLPISTIVNKIFESDSNFTHHILTNKTSKEVEKLCRKLNIGIFEKNNLPGVKVGDGRWMLNINGKVETSQPNKLYKTKNIDYDFILSDSEDLLNLIRPIFSDTPKVLITDKTNVLHNSIQPINPDMDFDLVDLILSNTNKTEDKKPRIKIVSGHSEKGGSTIAFINLTNKLNEYGYDCTFYGPQTFHLDKCKSDLINNLKFDEDDRLITHFINLQLRPNVKKVIFSCHEKWWWSFKNVHKFWDSCVFLHEQHRKFHNDYNEDYTIIPNLKESLVNTKKENVDMIAGVIGSIEERKQTHESILRALNDGCKKIILFGAIGGKEYFDTYVSPLIKQNSNIEMFGYTNNKQEMYDSIGRVYHSSKGEVACLVKDECYLTGTKFFGNSETDNEVSTLTNEEIINKWINILEL